MYATILGHLRKYGTVLTEHVGDPNLTEAGMCVYATTMFVQSRACNNWSKVRTINHTFLPLRPSESVHLAC